MESSSKQTILETAKYLRDVRPIDPVEIASYDQDLDESTVAQTLRNHAEELAIIETSEGIFTHPPTEPIPPKDIQIDRLPTDIETAIQTIVREELGESWWRGATGDHLRSIVRSFKSAYLARESVTYNRETAIGYLLYHFPATFASTSYVLEYLSQTGSIPQQLRFLDVGAGVGGQALAIDRFIPESTFVEYRAVEESAAATALLERILTTTGSNFHWDIQTADIDTANLHDSYDIVLLANVLNELPDPIAVLHDVLDRLAENGTVIAIEPADQNTSRELRSIETALARERSDVTVFGPTMRLWKGRRPSDNCWSFNRHEDFATPAFQTNLDSRGDRAGEFTNTDVKYSFSILRTDANCHIPFRPNRSEFLPLSESSDNISNRVNLCVVKLSRSLTTDEAAKPLYVIGDGSQSVEHFAVLTSESYSNHLLQTASYGDILRITQGLLLWNEDEDACNVVIDENTTIDRIGPHGMELA